MSTHSCTPSLGWRAILLGSGLLFSPFNVLAEATAHLTLTEGDIEHFSLAFAQPIERSGDRRERLSGRVTVPPDAVSVVTAPMDGLITRTHVADGMTVAAGEVLFTLSSPALIELQTEFLTLRDALDYQNAVLERERRLAAAGAIPERRLQDATLAQRQASTRLDSVKLRLRATGLSAPDLEALAQEGVLGHEVTIRAPVAGMISELNATTGERVPAVTPLAHLTALQRRWVEFAVPQAVAAQMQVGERVILASTSTEASIINIAMMVGDERNLVTVRCALPPQQPDRGPTLLPGQFVTGFWVGRETPLLTLPAAAIVHESQTDYLFVASEGGVDVVPVEVISREVDGVRVTGALRPDDRVVVRGTAQLKSLWLSQDDGPEGAE